MEFSIAGVTVSPILLVLWSVFVGCVFSTVGAAGGILAGVGHITIFGLKSANTIKPMNQVLTLVSPLISAPLYFKERRLVVPAAIFLGLGGIVGALIGSYLSSNYMHNMNAYKPLFGVITLFIAIKIWSELRPNNNGKSTQQAAKKANKAFEEKVKELKAAGRMNELKAIGVKFSEVGVGNTFTFAEQTFRFSALSPFTAGMLVAIVSASLGVGGGFLLVPYLSSVLGFPMFIVAGTALMSVIVTSFTSIINYLRMGSSLDFLMLSFELGGIVIGSYLGPVLSKYIKAQHLKIFLAVILTYIGTGYLLSLVGIKII